MKLRRRIHAILSSLSKPLLLAWASSALISAAPLQDPPGQGVLCLGTFIYFAEKTGTQCHPGENSEFQARISTYARRFDDYIIRNTGGDPAVLARFKDGQSLNSDDRAFICGGDVAALYDHLKAQNAGEIDKAVDELLARDGPPSFGDCV